MCQNPFFVEALARDRLAELQQSPPGSPTGLGARRRLRVIDAARHTTGWLLVDVGLRLAVPRGAINDTLARGSR